MWSGHTSVSVGSLLLLLCGHHHGVGQDADGRAVDHVGGDQSVVRHSVVGDSVMGDRMGDGVMGDWVGDGVVGNWEVGDGVGKSVVGDRVGDRGGK